MSKLRAEFRRSFCRCFAFRIKCLPENRFVAKAMRSFFGFLLVAAKYEPGVGGAT
jgi:hypothetical protein